MEHYELVQEMPSIERMTTQDRLKHARKRRTQQLKEWGKYEKALEKESSKKKKASKQDSTASQQGGLTKNGRRKKTERVRFIANIALLESAARNDLEEVRRLLENNVSPDVTNEDGLTALHQCCIDDNEEMLKLLVEFGANVNACDSEMWTPIHAAATCGHVTLCKHLIDSGAELLSVNADGNMPYDICEDEVTLDYIETEMAKRGITQEQIDQTRLTTERQMLSDLKSHLASGGDLEIVDAQGATMLHIASANGYLDVADFLLDNHVSVDRRDNESWQPIHAAAYWGQLELLEILVQNGADLDSKTKNGETPFDLCEDPDIKQRILDMKEEIETNKASRQRQGSSRRHKQSSSRNASMRRTSLRGEKSNLFKREAHEEALHFGLRLMQDDEDLTEMEEEKENLPATNIDDVTITFDDPDLPNRTTPPPGHQQPPPPHNNRPDPSRNGSQTRTGTADRLPGGDRNISSSNSKPQPAPRPSINNQGRPLTNANTHNDVAPRSGSEKKSQHPEDNRRDALDAQFQSMFLESLPHRGGSGINANAGSRSSTNSNQLHFYPPPMMDRTKNGHNNNNNNAGGGPAPGTTALTANSTNSSSANHSFREGQLRRFVAPPNAPVVGSEEEDGKRSCCVIL